MITSQQSRQKCRLGAQITQLVHTLALKKQWSKAFTTEHVAAAAGFGPDIVYKWRQDRVTPSDETIEILLEIGCNEAGLGRDWGTELVRVARCFEAMETVDRLWQAEAAQEIPHNLPKPTYTEFVGRQPERQRLLELLRPATAAPLIMVDGIGGVGKTALVINVAYQCLQASCQPTVLTDTPTFAVIIFVSAKQKYLTADGILPRAYAPDTLHAIYREIACVLDLDVTCSEPEELSIQIRHALSRQRTLLIIDNLETVADKDSVLAFLYDLPAQVKVVVTTREQRYYTPIQLDSLAPQEGTALIAQEADKQQIVLTDADVSQLYQGTGGIPAAIIYGVGQLASGRDIANVLTRLADHEGDIACFFFRDSVAPLRGRPAHHLLMAIALFAKRPAISLALEVAGLADDPQRANEAEVQLLRLSLIHKQAEYFAIHPLTREYTLAELAAQGDFERAARKRWVAAYRAYVARAGAVGPLGEAEPTDAHEWGAWYERYRWLAEEWENIAEVMQWCMQQRRYEELIHFWRHVRNFVFDYGQMTERRSFLQWIVLAAERQGDRQTQVMALYETALTLMASGQTEHLQAAEAALLDAWVLRHGVAPELHSYVADAFAEYYIQRQQYTEAKAWLTIATDCVTLPVAKAQPTPGKTLHTLYRRALCLLKQQHLGQAHALFTQVQTLSRQMNWDQLYYDAQHYLAEIAMAQNDLATAETLLRDGLRIVERNHDRRRVACYKRALSQLARQHARASTARCLAEEAQAIFATLGLRANAELLSSTVQLDGAISAVHEALQPQLQLG